ncbi:MAG: hypothetical protein CMH54_13655 [Myxococcales bacterium]|nr:hypothetical protein [Myxococcales bacterium]
MKKYNTYRVMGIDRMSGEDWVEAEFTTAAEAFNEALTRTRTEFMDPSIEKGTSTIYRAYDPDGRRLLGPVSDS